MDNFKQILKETNKKLNSAVYILPLVFVALIVFYSYMLTRFTMGGSVSDFSSLGNSVQSQLYGISSLYNFIPVAVMSVIAAVFVMVKNNYKSYENLGSNQLTYHCSNMITTVVLAIIVSVIVMIMNCCVELYACGAIGTIFVFDSERGVLWTLFVEAAFLFVLSFGIIGCLAVMFTNISKHNYGRFIANIVIEIIVFFAFIYIMSSLYELIYGQLQFSNMSQALKNFAVIWDIPNSIYFELALATVANMIFECIMMNFRGVRR